jgi:cell division protein FtsB
MTTRGSGGPAQGRGRRRSAASDTSAGRRPERTRKPRLESQDEQREEPPPRRRSTPRRRRRGAGLFGLAPTRRAAVLAIVVCALVLSISVPLRTYLSQREDLRVQEQHQEQLRTQVQQLQQRKAQLSDPAQVEAEARRRLRYVKPGETPYVVQLPGDGTPQQGGEHLKAQPPQGTWYENMWGSVSGG